MKNFRLHQQFLPFLLSVSAVLAPVFAVVQAPTRAFAEGASSAARIRGEVSSSQLTPLPGSQHPAALAQFDTGRVAGSTKLEGMSIYFNMSKSQKADLQKLMAAQQDPGSPQYHQWLTPEQFGSRFGLADADIAKVRSWLEQQGFSVDSVARGKTMIRFSGTVAQAEAAFGTEIHSYSLKTPHGLEKHFAPSTALSVPAAIAGVVQAVHNLDDFKPRSHLIMSGKVHPKSSFSSSDGQTVAWAPGDIALQYGIQAAYNAGYTGTNQTIVVIGQSEINTSDITAFQTAAGLPINAPQTVLVPNTGQAAFSAGDETESDLDLEWSGAIAKGATISLVYAGNAANAGAFDALQYAIDEKIGTIISSSYGSCETELAGFSLETAFAQAATQGQTIVSAAGDSGSTDCYGYTDLTNTQQEALAVDYPASSPYVTGVGGTEISQANSAYETQGSSYWEASSGTDIVTSLLQIVPEQAWNEDAICLSYVQYGSSAICAGGGGASALFTKPSWQAGVPGIPSDGQRDVPDISLNAAIYNPGYLLCTSDQTDWQPGQSASCNSGFEDSSSGSLTEAGGTSFAAPIFAGMVAIINQQQNYSTGQGTINPTLYSLASNAMTYATAFTDITTGDNKCDSGSTYCNGSIGFSAGTGYDQATGLGTPVLSSLASTWPASTGSSLIATTTTVSASNAAPVVNTSDTFTITVSSNTGTTVPTGTVTITVDSNTPITGNNLTSNGTFTYTTSFTTAGTHTILAQYQGDSTHATSTGSATVNVSGTSSGVGTFTMTASNVTVAQGASGNSTITVTPAGGYTGTVNITLTNTSNNSALNNLCYQFSNGTSTGTAVVTNTSAASTQINLDTNAADCASQTTAQRTHMHSLRSALSKNDAAKNGPLGGGMKAETASIAFAGLLLAGFLGRYSRKFRGLACLIVLAVVGLTVSACGGSSNTISDPPKGTYTMTLTGQDANSTSIPTTTTTFTFTIQ